MYAVIMGGGEGSRLRPLTLTMPKPLVPVAGKPAIVRILSLLASHGIKNAAVTLRYLGDMLEKRCGRACEEVSLEYFYENEPLGTAGSVKGTQSFLERDKDDSFLIISGDAVAETDLTTAISFHRENNADITLVLAKREDAGEYGVVVCGGDGRIISFIEKPSPSEQLADTVNTGIYIMKKSMLDRIPSGVASDFGRDIFPTLLKGGARLFGYLDSGYWCDIGDLGALYDCTLRTAAIEDSLTNGGYIDPTADIAPSARIHQAVIFAGAKIEAGAIIDRAVIGENVIIHEGAVIKRGSVTGSDCVIGRNAVLNEGVRLVNSTTVANGASISEGGAFFGIRGGDFIDGGIFVRRENSSAVCAMRIGEAAFKAATGSRGRASSAARVGVIADLGCAIYGEAALCGIAAAGGEAYDLIPDGYGYDALGAYAAVTLSLDCVIVISETDGGMKFALFDGDGLYPIRSFERDMAAALNMGVKSSDIGKIIRVQSLTERYKEDISRLCGELDGLRFNINDVPSTRLCSDILRSHGAVEDANANLRFYINSSSNLFTVYYGDTRFDMWHVLALTIPYSGVGETALPRHSPDGLIKMLGEQVKISLYRECPHDKSEADIRRLAGDALFLRDAAAQCLSFSTLLCESGLTVPSLFATLPKFASVKMSVSESCPSLSEIGETETEGASVEFRIGRVRVFPRRGGYTLISEAVTVEAAEEIMGLTKQKIDEIKSRK